MLMNLTIPVQQEFNENVNQTRVGYYTININDLDKNEKTLLYGPWIPFESFDLWRPGCLSLIEFYLSQQHFLAATKSNSGSLTLYSHEDGTVIWRQDIGRNNSFKVRCIQDNYVVMCTNFSTSNLRIFCLKTGNLISSLPYDMGRVMDVQISGHRIAHLCRKLSTKGELLQMIKGQIVPLQFVSVFDIKTSKILFSSKSDLKLRHIVAFKLERDRIFLYNNEARGFIVKFGVWGRKSGRVDS